MTLIKFYKSVLLFDSSISKYQLQWNIIGYYLIVNYKFFDDFANKLLNFSKYDIRYFLYVYLCEDIYCIIWMWNWRMCRDQPVTGTLATASKQFSAVVHAFIYLSEDHFDCHDWWMFLYILPLNKRLGRANKCQHRKW